MVRILPPCSTEALTRSAAIERTSSVPAVSDGNCQVCLRREAARTLYPPTVHQRDSADIRRQDLFVELIPSRAVLLAFVDGEDASIGHRPARV